MDLCLFVSDLHGNLRKYETLFSEIKKRKPSGVFIGGDILPSIGSDVYNDMDFIDDFFYRELVKLKKSLMRNYPDIFIILGNDDPKIEETRIVELEKEGLYKYIQNRRCKFKGYSIYGYSYIPPSPFLFKDWEKYDVSRYVDPGCVHPSEGYRSVSANYDVEYSTIKADLEELIQEMTYNKTIVLFHSPPYKTALDRAALDGQSVDYVPLDVHVGSIAIQRFIKVKQPYLTMHGHVHESSNITGKWNEKIGQTLVCSAAYHLPELALIEFYLQDLQSIRRIIL